MQVALDGKELPEGDGLGSPQIHLVNRTRGSTDAWLFHRFYPLQKSAAQFPSTWQESRQFLIPEIFVFFLHFFCSAFVDQVV